jgi:acetyl/propionyl-CoA carboxylase alpha subunit
MIEGAKISRFYDPMISKLIARGATREFARLKMLRALEEYEIAGVRTNIGFARHIIASDDFQRADFHTRSVDEVFLQSYAQESNIPVPDEEILAAALAKMVENSDSATNTNYRYPEGHSATKWTSVGRQDALRDGQKHPR